MFIKIIKTLIILSLIFGFQNNIKTESVDNEAASTVQTSAVSTPAKRTVKSCPNGGYTFGELSSCPKPKTTAPAKPASSTTNSKPSFGLNLPTNSSSILNKTLNSSKPNTKGKMIWCNNKGYLDRTGNGCPKNVITAKANNSNPSINKTKPMCQSIKTNILPTPKTNLLKPSGLNSNPTDTNAPIRSDSTIVGKVTNNTNITKSNTTSTNANCQKLLTGNANKLVSNIPAAKITPKNISDQCKLGTTKSTLNSNFGKSTNQPKPDSGNYGLFGGLTIGGFGNSKTVNSSGADNFFKIKNCKVGSTSSSITEPQIRGDTIKPKPDTKISTPSESGNGDYAFASIMDKISTRYNRQCGKYFDSSQIIGKAGYGWQTTNSLRGNGTGCCYGAVWAGLIMNKAANPSSPFAKAFGVIDTVTANYGTPANDFHRAMQSNINGQKAYKAAGLRYTHNTKNAPIGSIAVHETITPGYGDINVKVGENKWVNYATMGFMANETSGSYLHIYSPM